MWLCPYINEIHKRNYIVVFVTGTHRSPVTALISHYMKPLWARMKPIIIKVSTYGKFELSARSKPLVALRFATNNYMHVHAYKLSRTFYKLIFLHLYLRSTTNNRISIHLCTTHAVSSPPTQASEHIAFRQPIKTRNKLTLILLNSKFKSLYFLCRSDHFVI